MLNFDKFLMSCSKASNKPQSSDSEYFIRKLINFTYSNERSEFSERSAEMDKFLETWLEEFKAKPPR